MPLSFYGYGKTSIDKSHDETIFMGAIWWQPWHMEDCDLERKKNNGIWHESTSEMKEV